MAEWIASDLSQLDLLAIQIDGLRVVATTWCSSRPSGSTPTATSIRFGLMDGATENAVVQALIDNLIERGLDPVMCRLLIVVDGAKALSVPDQDVPKWVV
jgi:putative transposase